MHQDNSDQREYWSGVQGQAWVSHQGALDTLFTEVTDIVLRAAAPAPGARVLDVGCGTGATSLALARAVRAGTASGAVTGLDISQPLLDLAAQRANAQGLPIRFVAADAQVWQTEDRFDLVTSRFGVMFFADTVAAFRNIRSLLAPGARLVFATWAAAPKNPWFALSRKIGEAQLGAGTPPDPSAPARCGSAIWTTCKACWRRRVSRMLRARRLPRS